MKNFLEKDLETIIWENFVRCEGKGLNIDQAFFQHGMRYRQLNLAPYGIADLIYVRYSASQKSWHILVVELKRGKIDLAAYQQAKRYQTALHVLLRKSREATGQESVPLVFSTILIGSEVETNGDFVYVYNYDFGCRAFTYSYGFDGIAFEEVGKEWRADGDISVPATIALSQHWAEHRIDAEAGYESYCQDQEADKWRDEQAVMQQYGDFSKALLITPEGVLCNEDWLSLPEREEDAAE